jgi:DNA-directed RNA polymerase sigma subunit (sigma70/sigma32)
MYRRQYQRHSITAETSELWDEENLSTQIDEFYDQPSAAGAPLPGHERESQAYDRIMRNELLHHIDNLMRQQLTEREQSIVERYFGIGCTPHRPVRIAEDFDMTVREVEDLVKVAIIKLRQCDYAIYLWQYLHGKKI